MDALPAAPGACDGEPDRLRPTAQMRKTWNAELEEAAAQAEGPSVTGLLADPTLFASAERKVPESEIVRRELGLKRDLGSKDTPMKWPRQDRKPLPDLGDTHLHVRVLWQPIRCMVDAP